jgi:hypothetical protein
MSRQLRQVSWLTLSALLIGFPLFTHAAEAPGALTFIVKDQNTDRPLCTAGSGLRSKLVQDRGAALR